jgi:transcriptional regulator with XRE-family HTH domain
MSTREELRKNLPIDREYRHAYADEILNLSVCTQIRALREQQKMKQGELARAIGTTQTAISRIENVNYSAWNIRTLKKIAEALDLRLRITFENFGTLWRDVSSLNRQLLERARRIEEDPEFSMNTDDSAQDITTMEVDIPLDAYADHAGTTPSNVVVPFRRPESKPSVPVLGGAVYTNARVAGQG